MSRTKIGCLLTLAFLLAVCAGACGGGSGLLQPPDREKPEIRRPVEPTDKDRREPPWSSDEHGDDDEGDDEGF